MRLKLLRQVTYKRGVSLLLKIYSREDLSEIETIETIVEIVDAELIEDIKYQRSEIGRQRSGQGIRGQRAEVVRRRWGKDQQIV